MKDLSNEPVVSFREGEGDDDQRPYTPWLVIPYDADDKGVRSAVLTYDLGPDNPSVVIEEFQELAQPSTAVSQIEEGKEYQVAITVKNYGTAPCYCLCIDILQWTRTEVSESREIHYYDFVSYCENAIIMGGEIKTLRSALWKPLPSPLGSTHGDLIVRVYDPLTDNLTNFSDNSFHVQNDRHLAHLHY